MLSIGDRVVYGPDPRAKGFQLPEAQVGTVRKLYDLAGVPCAEVRFPSGMILRYAASEFTKCAEYGGMVSP